MMKHLDAIQIYDSFLTDDDIIAVKEFTNHDINVSTLPILIAYLEERLVGLLTYRPDDYGYQIISFYINPLLKKQHIGSRLMYNFVERIGSDSQIYGYCKIGSSGFYEAVGFDLQYDEVFQAEIFRIDKASKIRERLQERYGFE